MERGATSPHVAPYVAWYWSVTWNLDGAEPHRQVTVPHVSSHLVVEDGEARLHGVPRTRFERLLEGRGRVVGARFTGGGMAALIGRPVVDGPVPASVIPGLDSAALAREVTAASTPSEAFGALDAHLSQVVPAAVDSVTELVERALEVARSQATIRRVGDLAAAVGLSVRSLQAMFSAHVGVSPGWAIRRCRIQEAALVATEGGDVDWARLAVELGYSDQAHLVREFKATVGVPPARYARGDGQ